MNSLIVTGGGSGLGKELALLFSQKGFHILLAGRTVEKLTGVKHEIEASGGSADTLQLDVSNGEEVSRVIGNAGKKYDIHGVVNNAGVGHFGPFVEISEKQINEMLDTNVIGTILVTKTVLPLLVDKGEGRVMNIISTAGLRGKVNEAVYCASKFAVRGFTEALQKEYEGSNIKFNAVYMGGMNTPFWDAGDYVKDPSRLPSAKSVAEVIMVQIDQDTIIIESKK
ncbi:SDR family oxidoreductase [Bacillus sp. FJAT-29814]|uniref:SDR family NAD(P)-dependent oxidoreductase n=1 Tax=Bacillus sp. FJAT-29814 TaxID=1729688 RepID=UPI00082F5724|nr:SDR family oxidoreductase [Bacillus sp. FJAT-29814]